MTKSQRLSRLLQILHRRPMTPIDELADRLGVSESTVHRDLAELRAGSPDYSDPAVAQAEQPRPDAVASVPEPPPKVGGEPITPSLLKFLRSRGLDGAAALVEERDAFGREKYGTPLCRGNGRNAVEDLRQEIGDALQYAWLVNLEGRALDRATRSMLGGLVGALLAVVTTDGVYAALGRYPSMDEWDAEPARVQAD